MRKLATIRIINSIRPIENADAIETAIVDGWEVVVKKGEFKPGDKVVYIEIDSIVPDWPYFEFMRTRKFRVKTIKLRGQISQGLIVPTDILPDMLNWSPEGTDVTEVLRITKYDPQVAQEAQEEARKPKNWLEKKLMRYAWYRNWIKEDKGFPSWISKTDETRVQNMTHQYARIVNEDIAVAIKEKLDGSSITVFVEKKSLLGWTRWDYGVCSRNNRVGKVSKFWMAAEELGVKGQMIEMAQKYGRSKLAIQGELIGPGIQKNKYQLKEYEIRFFSIQWVDRYGVKHTGNPSQTAVYLNALRVPLVPTICECCSLPETIPECLIFAEGKSALNQQTEREGIVIRTHENPSVSFKAISNKFLLKNDE